MRAALMLTFILLLSAPDLMVHAAEPCPDCGTVSGNITVWRTRVRTEGARNDRDVTVYLQQTGNETFTETSQTVAMDQKNLIFIPHVLPVIKGTSVQFLNSDSVNHNVYLLFENTGETLDLGTWGQGQTTGYQFKETGAVIVLCKLHLEMAAYVIALENPFFDQAVLDGSTQSGAFTIKNVPPGSYMLNAWHKKLKIKGGPTPITVEKNGDTPVDITITKAKYAK